MSSETELEIVPPRQRRWRGFEWPIWVLEHSQDVASVTVGAVLTVLALVLMVSGIWDFLTGPGPVMSDATALLDNVLLILILVEIVHTVVLSLRAHQLVAQPFIVVGLIAVIRRILFLLSGQGQVSAAELAVLLGLVVAFVGGLIAVSRFEKQAG